MEEQELDRSEAATPFKLMRARQKGSVARGLDLGFLTGLGTFAAFFWISGEGFARRIAQASAEALAITGDLAPGSADAPILAARILGQVMVPIALLAGMIFAVVLLFEMVQTGVVFSAQPLAPDFSRLNPAAGLKRLFSMKLLIETAKAVLKFMLYTGVTALVAISAYRTLLATTTDAHGLMEAMRAGGFRLVLLFVAAAAFFALLDQLLTRRDFAKRMRMSRRELRRESRDREGDPRLKQQRRRLHGEFVKLSQSLRNIRGADVLVTNPQHLAVALRYRRETMAAPIIVSKGARNFALRLRRLAIVHNVVIVENKPLAQALYRLGELNRQIPEACYAGVADIYLDLAAKAKLRDGSAADV